MKLLNIPNSITCCNLISGCIAIIYALSSNAEIALLWIVIGAIFDFFDGMTARLLHVSSPIGKELDSLADVVTFGVAPSTILFNELNTHALPETLEPARLFLPFAAFLMAAFSALRLAKFNLDERQAMGFIGLPTPANALFWGSLIVGAPEVLHTTPWVVFILITGIFLSCWLLICEVPMFALKFKQWSWKGNEVRYLFILSCIPLLLWLHVSGIAAIILWYIILSVIVSKKKEA